MKSQSHANTPSLRPEQTDQGLPRPAETEALEQLVEQAAEAAPLPADALPEDLADVRSSGFSLRDKFLNIKSLASFGIAFAILGFAFWRADINLADMWRQIGQTNPWLYAAGFLVFYGLFPVRALRWRIILRSAGFEVDSPQARKRWAGVGPLSEFIGLSWFANCVVPAKLGDAYRGYLVKKNGDASFSRTLGTIFAERIVDMIVLFGMLVVSGLLVFRGHLNSWTERLFIIGIVLTILLVIGLMSMRYLSPLIRRALPKRFQDFYARFEEGTLSSFRPSRLPVLLLLTIVVWLGESMRLFFVIEAMGGLGLSLSAIIFVALASSLLTAVPALPGGLGLVEVGIAGVMMLFDVGQTTSTAVAFLDRIINYWSIVILGLVLYLFSKRK
ncbi:lysylphosphatidylglycerol synthase transmembrane domain-containing protein [Herpetosiphon geysericola]|uniref:lysylphosphatidylglycerol synthase transmembrane domain-containing protein n=1 Tax=Herpetosiphon geysericola TaxID=70996 RepID=UPI0006C8FB9A|nr:lysylphosphatidylglycerol synthase transmembrane domain-containing protein [Herpetosiphon geysericola]